MIKTFAHSRLKRLFERGEARYFPAKYVQRIQDILAALYIARTIENMKVPAWRTHRYSGIPENELPKYSSDVDKRRGVRILYRWNEKTAEAYEVDYENVHS